MKPGVDRGIRVLPFLCAALALCCLPAASFAQTERVSVASNGAQASGDSGVVVQPGLAFSIGSVSISSDGRFVAFVSDAPDLVQGDLNHSWDVFVRDRQAGTTERVSVSSGGLESDGRSGRVSITADGRYVAFSSDASNLVQRDTHPSWEVFVRDRVTGKNELVSVDPVGVPFATPSGSRLVEISPNGRFVLFDVGSRVYVRDRQRGTTEVMGEGLIKPYVEADSTHPTRSEGTIYTSAASISSDGRIIAFTSTGVLPGSGPTCQWYPGPFGDTALCGTNVYLHDRERGTLVRQEGPSGVRLSADGRFLAGGGHGVPGAPNRFGTVRDLEREQTQFLPLHLPGESTHASWDLALSADGRFLAFGVWTDVDGRVPPNQAVPQVALYDWHSGAVDLVSAGLAGEPGVGESSEAAVSADGRFVAFASKADNLVEGDTNGKWDVFVRDLGAARSHALGAFAVFEKDGVELIARLGHPSQLNAVAVEPPAGPPFHGSFQGARFSMIGSLNTRVRSAPGVPRPNLLFSGTPPFDPHSVGDEALGTVFGALAAPGGFFERWRDLPSDGSRTSGLIDASDPRSLTSALGAPYPLSVRIDGQGRRSLIPGFGATHGNLRNLALPLLVSEHGVIERLTLEDLPLASELFAVFSAGGWECIAHLGDLFELAERPLELDLASCPNTFASGVAGARVARGGAVERDHARANFLFSAPLSGAPSLAEFDVLVASAALWDAEQGGFIDQLPGLFAGPGSSVELPQSDARSYTSRLAGAGPALSALPQLQAWPAGASAAEVSLHGAVAQPLAQLELLRSVVLDASEPATVRFSGTLSSEP